MDFKQDRPIWVVRTTLKGWPPELHGLLRDSGSSQLSGLAVFSTEESAEERAKTLRHSEQSADVEQHAAGELGKLIAEPFKGVWFDDQWFYKGEVLGGQPKAT